MCGICGKLDTGGAPVGESLLRAMCRSFAYRGPDDEGVYSAPLIGLGHRRLSIIDLSPAGHQPMSNENGTVWLVFNGEVYNFESLRKELLSKGHVFRSQTDCEAIIHLYEDEGIDCLKRLNGMFALAVWDEGKRRLWLARDRLGIKPLNYYWDEQRLVFASEIKAILCDPDVRREIDPEALDLYLALNYIPAPRTIFRRMQKLLPGHYLLAAEGTVKAEPYWDLPDHAGPPLGDHPGAAGDHQGLETRKRELYTLLESSVKRRLIADVPLGAFLSGGIDSSIIVALMARHSNRPVKTFSIGYRDLPSFDETAYAREVARFNRTEHHEFKLGYRDILDAFPTVLENVDEPFADSSAVPTYIVSKETKQHVTVALSGDGGDELFAGYRMYRGEHWAKHYKKIPRLIRDHVIGPLVEVLPDARDKPRGEAIRRLKKFLRGAGLPFPERFCSWREVFPFPLRQRLLRAPLNKNGHLEQVRRFFETEKRRFDQDAVNLMLSMDVKGLLPGDMLTKVDRMSMVSALEVRVPFLDHTVVEYAFELEGNLKLRGRTGKYILLETFKDLLPPALYNRPKWGFEMPIGAWLRSELKFLIDEYLSEDLLKQQDIFDRDVVAALVQEHMSGRRDTSWPLWNLIVFQHWHRTWM